MKLKQVDETTHQVWDDEETNLLFTGDLKACDDFMLEEIRKKIEADPEWFINQMKSFSQQIKAWKQTLEGFNNQQNNKKNDHKDDSTGKNATE